VSDYPTTLAAARRMAAETTLPDLMGRAGELRNRRYPDAVSYSPKVFIPLTQLCRDVCHYCTFAKTPKKLASPYLPLEEVLAVARRGETQGCREALFTLGEKPELRYRTARDWLAERGYASTIDYVVAAAGTVLRETRLIPHINAGTLSRSELRALRAVGASMGIMVESGSGRLAEAGGPHYGSPDKRPWRRYATLIRAGRARIPMTTGILIGIGESRDDRLRDLVAIGRIHRRWGHIQEVIVQNFRAKPNTRMALAPEPDSAELCWTIAMARLILGPDMSIQAPPNLSGQELTPLIEAGINDWGGVSPVTPDHVNPEAPWPHLQFLREQTARTGRQLQARLTVYPQYVADPDWLEPMVRTRCLQESDATGFLRECDWRAGGAEPGVLPRRPVLASTPSIPRVLKPTVTKALGQSEAGRPLESADIEALFGARDADFWAVVHQADALRRQQAGDTVGFVVNRNINYTNVCQYSCHFCAFSKGGSSKRKDVGREAPYDIDGVELVRRGREAWHCGATEVCLQGGIHPDYTGDTYLNIVRSLRAAVPDLHLHAFSPLEVSHGASTLGLSVEEYLVALKEAGLNSLPGTAAEILVDPVRALICPDKLGSDEWLDIMAAAHRAGLKTTATIMFGHVESPADWAAHLLAIRGLQETTGGFTEFVPLPFVAEEAPIYRRGKARPGPTLREAFLMHAVARLVLGDVIPNIQASWVKLGRERALDCLDVGANDLGGTLINESITRAAGAGHGQWWTAPQMVAGITSRGRRPRMRKTDYGDAPPERVAVAMEQSIAIDEPVYHEAGRRARSKRVDGC